MALAYTAPTWEDGSGTGISASQLQAMCNCIEGLVQGTDKAVHSVSINGSVITLTFADGTQETGAVSNLKGIASIQKTGTSGNVDTYTIIYTDGSTDTFTVTNGSNVVNDGTLTIKQNGTTKQTFSANQSTDAAVDIISDEFVATATVTSGAISFSGIDDTGTFGYKVFADVTSSSTNLNPTAQLTSISGEGTSSMSLAYSTDADEGSTCYLRQIK